VKITHAPASVEADDVERLRELGWRDAAVHDAIQVVSYFNYINRVADAVGIEDEPDW
jgi:alkylhydroperoxidase family enzyme